VRRLLEKSKTSICQLIAGLKLSSKTGLGTAFSRVRFTEPPPSKRVAIRDAPLIKLQVEKKKHFSPRSYDVQLNNFQLILSVLHAVFEPPKENFFLTYVQFLTVPLKQI